MVFNAIVHLAEAAWQHPDMTGSYAAVNDRLQNRAAKGIMAKGFKLGCRIEDVIVWQPGADPEPSREGTPDDPRLKYIEYD